MTAVQFDGIRAPAAAGQTWLRRLFEHLLAWQAHRAQRVIRRHAHLIADCSTAFQAHERSAPGNATWSALHHGATCDAGLRFDPPARDLTAL